MKNKFLVPFLILNIFLFNFAFAKTAEVDVDKIIEAANKNEATAQLKLAKMYLDGNGVKKNNQEALLWFEKAAHNNSIDANLLLAIFYYLGENGVEKNENLAQKYFEQAALQGSPEAINFLAEIVKEEQQKQAEIAINMQREKRIKELEKE